jgi:hypothetical protein
MTQLSEINQMLLMAFMWMVYSLLSAQVNNELKTLIIYNPLFAHVLGYLTMIFLFNDPSKPLLSVFMTSFIAYVLLKFMLQSKWYFSSSTMLFLIIHEIVEKRSKYEENEKNEIMSQKYDKIMLMFRAFIIVWIIIGIIQMIIIKKQKEKNKKKKQKYKQTFK